ncbi:cysteine-rich receptor-like protein kinase 25 isoform X2 [Morus notabilis]|uniref:cysteine-rich receptor-like protein kinase 25 isoform X2 n=1 Tax=Morus notabilis TaxID=981085 RepID=UPI000CED38EF|nr:cysteine-rich receptor-like protein kinase 25 isoform X2 [Morus notabilis]
MPSLNLMHFLIMISILVITSKSITPIHRSHFCSNTTTFSPNTTYNSHLNKLLASLSAAAALSEFFAQKTVGVSPPGSSVYGSYLCRGDLDTTACHTCIATATDDAPQRCPFKKEAVLWYDGCMLRYSNRPFFGIMEEKPSSFVVDPWNGTRQEGFKKALEEAIMSESALAEAANNTSSNGNYNNIKQIKYYFRTKEVKVTSFQTICSLVQCTPDLESGECRKCLKDAMRMIGSCCEGKEGATILFPSCNVRFELFPFYNRNTTTANDQIKPKGKDHRISILIVIATVISIIFVSLAYFFLGYCLSRLRRAKRKKDPIPQQNGNEITSTDSLQFDLITLEIATNEFSNDNKLGHGGFGDVYKGILGNGQQIAVKRPSRSSGRESLEQFKNEVALVAKLQHRNLVRLLGFCMEADPEKRIQLDWPTRCKIIEGIARGILYLHEDSRLRIIHRDLKASNILLDGEMNPKISDFGIAKMFGIDDQTEGNTKTIVGTYGYMAPEYAMGGLYSTKSDVFSFGVILLEILTGTKNSGFHPTKLASSLLPHAWQLWNEGKALELMDPVLKTSCPANEFLRNMQIGLLCVQEEPLIRPTMSSVAMMLKSDHQSSMGRLSNPRPAPFSGGRFNNDMNEHDELGIDDYCSTSSLTVSVLDPR